MTLWRAQILFSRRMADLLSWIVRHDGWEITFGDFNRPDQSGHMAGSLHYVRLAADINLFVNGEWKASSCPEWQDIGSYWKSLGSECAWGGDFTPKVDLNHFSLHWQGKA